MFFFIKGKPVNKWQQASIDVSVNLVPSVQHEMLPWLWFIWSIGGTSSDGIMQHAYVELNAGDAIFTDKCKKTWLVLKGLSLRNLGSTLHP